ncbi:hypothetical protein GTO89_14445 [Heliobacterium gestii]|uniref:Stage V sporulation protein G n=1 Tax=Heliomicrobium gestii TaxID=2699 RepID=A0A845LF89_HELGE|nr:SpoVG family protein [Heliomicrobium gestii]MBM7867963.1 stage V sporulation protein G [Heliomicrobium gestii]MZP44231.1 hypothetical protein [Heliomicrobium gestii]
MQITDVQITRVQLDKIKAIASITLDDALIINGIKVIEGPEGLAVEMPRRKPFTEGIRYTAHPTNKEAWEYVTQTVIKAFRKMEYIEV